MTDSSPSAPGRVSTAALHGVPETLLIPLVARARAREHFGHLGFVDPDAERILARLDADVRAFARDPFTQRVVIVRARALDAIARRFFMRHPEGLGVSLGAGLCTRFTRISPRGGAWVDVDLPEVIALKRQLVEETSRYRLVAKSLLDPDWSEAIGWEPGRPILLVSEGVLLYLPPEGVRAFITGAAERFTSGGAIAFDFIHPWLVKGAKLQPSVRQTSATFGWGVKHAREVASWHPRLEVIDELSLLEGLGPLTPPLRLLQRVARRHPYGLAHLGIRAVE